MLKDQLKQKTSQLIKNFVFSNPYSEPYINELDFGIDEGYCESKYELYRALFFLNKENGGSSYLSKDFGRSQSYPYLAPRYFLAEGPLTAVSLPRARASEGGVNARAMTHVGGGAASQKMG